MQKVKLSNTAIVINPASANGLTLKKWPMIKKTLREEGFSFVFSFSEGPEHATALTRNYLNEGYDLIVSVGGDGTVNEVINGFFDHGKPISIIA